MKRLSIYLLLFLLAAPLQAGNLSPKDGPTVMKTDQANTVSTGAQDFGAATSLRVPVAAGCTTATNGFICYDSTANMWHVGQSGADAKFPTFTVTPVNAECAVWVVSGSNYRLGSSGCIGAGSADTLTNKDINAEGTGNVITIPYYWDLDLVGVAGGTASHIWNDDPLSTACTPLAVTGSNRTTGVCTFPDVDGNYGRQITRYLPTGWTGAVDAEIWWRTTGSGNARFQIQTICYADDEADDASFNTASVVTAAAGTSGRPNKQAITGITTTGCAAGELMRIRFFRNRTEGSDSLNAALDVEKVVLVMRVAH